MRLIAPLSIFGAAMLASAALAQSVEVRPLEDEIELERDLGDPVEAAEVLKGSGAVVLALDKFTGERSRLTVKIGEESRFQRMQIEVKSCNARISARSAEATAFIQVFDTKDSPALRVFSGWMFSNSPALSALDHPRYDFWVASCITSSKEASAGKSE